MYVHRVFDSIRNTSDLNLFDALIRQGLSIVFEKH